MGLALLTDFYELTMMQGYFFSCRDERAVFELFFRRQPFGGGYTVFAGLGPLVEALEGLSFGAEDIAYLQGLALFRPEFIDFLKTFSFRGDMDAVAEGSVVFPGEPVLRVRGNIMEAQLVESIVLNFINFQSLVATKAARVTWVAGGRPVMEFGLRRAQGASGALAASRAAYIGGVASTSNTLAARLYGIPASGTMAHSWVMNFRSEREAFERYAEQYPERCVLLVDTYDTLKSGIPGAIEVFNKLKERRPSLMAIRIDSGDLEYLSKKARKMLDRAGLEEVKIVASSDLDEYIMHQLIESGAPVDLWGVGTRLVTGWNDPALTGVYKIVARGDDGGFEPLLKISNQAEKITNPGVKSVVRFYGDGGQALADLVCLEEEIEAIMKLAAAGEPVRFNHPATDYAHFTLRGYASARPLLEPAMRGGAAAGTPSSLVEMRAFRGREVDSLDETYKRLLNPHVYKVSLSDRLKGLKTGMIRSIRNEYE